ncbi:hypothetical protein EN786_33450 [Mesorhizobium sp. M4B.F.Ca.ET.143.01.1.1]|nr:hypothetical protein EOA34_24385 [Mesorhizobium sp. M4B.F.Ca.ET.013.02.1.1]TGV18465.1 hypothetical protein EN786_33450 [Mesorhizobium sp. M4B.F.Ca.ET.143.01.1.1]
MPTDRIYLCCGATDMRRGINSLARMVQQVLALNPHTGEHARGCAAADGCGPTAEAPLLDGREEAGDRA